MILSRRKLLITPLIVGVGACAAAPPVIADSFITLSSVINKFSSVARHLREHAPEVAGELAQDTAVHVGVDLGLDYIKSFFDKTEELKRLSIKAGLDVRLVLEAAAIIDTEKMIDYVKNDVRMWYQFKHGSDSINEFTYEVSNPTNDVLGGQIIFNFADKDNVVFGDAIWTDPFDIAPKSKRRETVQLSPVDLKVSGEKVINVVSKPAGINLSVPKIVILPMSPS